ncbi:MAG: WD40 repeat domain-containing protein, partial [Lewinellaceae bacterium]|nr:WD40 repeat domain-containing protein [Lewinellaceae bacterium]
NMWEERAETRPFREFSPNWGAIVQKMYSPSGRYLFQLHQDQHGPFTALVWNFETQEYLKVETGETKVPFSPLSFTPDEKYIVIPVRNVAEVWPAHGNWPVAYKLPAPFSITQAFFGRQGENIYAETANGNVYKWDLQGYPIARLGTSDRELGTVFIGPSGKNIVLQYTDNDPGAVEAWSIGEAGWTRQSGTFKLSKNEKTVTGSDGNDIDISNYVKVDYNTYRYDRYGATKTTSADGKYDITIDNKSKSVTIRSKGEKETLLELLGHELWIESVSFSPDGRFILTTSNDEMILWDWNGNNVFSVPEGGIAGFLPDGRSIFRWPTPYMEYYQIGQIDLFTIDVDELVNWADGHGIYKLSEEDKRKYGVVDSAELNMTHANQGLNEGYY